MCSICGGSVWNSYGETIYKLSRDRGRDDEGSFFAESGEWVANHRAAPTTETEKPSHRQPLFDAHGAAYVFNGVIANDKELGVGPDEIDTRALPLVLSEVVKDGNLEAFRDAVARLKGSFALAVMRRDGVIFLAANYKPLFIAQDVNNHYYFSSLAHHIPPFLRPWRFPAYSVGVLGGASLPLPRRQSPDALVICSSGLDSTAVAAYAAQTHPRVRLIHFNYGCKATTREMRAVSEIGEYLRERNPGVSVRILPIPGDYFGSASPLLREGDAISGPVEGAEYAHEWVPARNLVMLALSTAYAEANGYGHLYLGTNLEEAGAYPDNEEQFIEDYRGLLYGAVNEGTRVDVHTPLGSLMKHEIVRFGLDNGAPFHLTWSCYRGGEKHCGRCGPCFMRRTAFARNALVDPVDYEA